MSIISSRPIVADYNTVPMGRKDLQLADDIEKAVNEVILTFDSLQDRLSDISEHITAKESYDLVVYAADITLTPQIRNGFLELAKAVREKLGFISAQIQLIKDKLKEYGMIEQTVTLITVLSQHAEMLFLYFKDLLRLINRISKESDFLTKFKTMADTINKEIFEFNTKTLGFALLGFINTHVRGKL